MEKGNPGNMKKESIKPFNAEKYGMMLCPDCNGMGYVENPTHQCCPSVEALGISKEKKRKEISWHSSLSNVNDDCRKKVTCSKELATLPCVLGG